MIKKKINNISKPNQAEMLLLEKLYTSNKFNELEIQTEKLIKKNPNIATLYNILGFSLHKNGQLNKAATHYEKALNIDPKFSFAHNNLGNLYKELGRFEEALSHYESSIKLNPNYAEAYYNQALLYKKIRKYNKSIESFHNALKIKPDYFEAHFDLGQVYITVGKFSESIECFQKTINLKPDFIPSYNNIFFTLLYMKEDKHNFFISLAKKFLSSQKKIDKSLLTINRYEKKPKKLRIGFVSGNFYEHPVGYFLLGTIKNLKDKNLELIAYSNFSKKDNLHIKLKSYFDNWNEIGDKNDVDIINQIRKDAVNILIDLDGHSAKNKLSIFINKAAPIQLSWGGYPGFLGIPEIDYVIGDPYVTPKREEKYFIEKVFVLPNIWICFTPPESEIKIEELPAIKNGYITFGSFNNFSKINNEDVIFLWSKILKSIPKSKIFLKSSVFADVYFKELIISKFKKNNISSDSIILEGRSLRKDYLASYNKIDIILDTFPYSGATTTFEAIWMGVPVLTKKGYNRFSSHETESINHNSDMSDWIANDADEYFAKAIKFSSNISELSNIRKNLRKKTLKLPTFNSNLFANGFNEALWKIWNNFSEK